jgi:hypothetical protein
MVKCHEKNLKSGGLLSSNEVIPKLGGMKKSDVQNIESGVCKN